MSVRHLCASESIDTSSDRYLMADGDVTVVFQKEMPKRVDCLLDLIVKHNAQ